MASFEVNGVWINSMDYRDDIGAEMQQNFSSTKLYRYYGQNLSDRQHFDNYKHELLLWHEGATYALNEQHGEGRIDVLIFHRTNEMDVWLKAWMIEEFENLNSVFIGLTLQFRTIVGPQGIGLYGQKWARQMRIREWCLFIERPTSRSEQAIDVVHNEGTWNDMNKLQEAYFQYEHLKSRRCFMGTENHNNAETEEKPVYYGDENIVAVMSARYNREMRTP